MQRTSGTLCSAFLIEIVGDRKCIGIDFDHRIHSWTSFVDTFNAGEVLLGEIASGKPATLQATPQIVEGNLVQLEAACATGGLGGHPLWQRGDTRGGRQAGLQEISTI